MAGLPAIGEFLARAGSQVTRGPLFEAWLAFNRQLLGGDQPETLTISAGAITPTRADLVVDTEGAAASDNLDTINGTNFAVGQLIAVGCVDGSRKVVVRSAMGNITLSTTTTFTCDHWSARIFLKRTASGWQEVWRFYGQSVAAARVQLGIGGNAPVTGVPSTYSHATGSQALAGTAADAVMTPAAVAVAMTSPALMITNHPSLTPLLVGDSIIVARGGVLYSSDVDSVLDAPQRYAQSGEIGITATAGFAGAHGLLGTLREIRAFLRCKIAQGNFLVGEEVPFECAVNDAGFRYANWGISGANWFFRMSNDSSPVRIYDRNSGASLDLVDANWRAFVRLWS